MTPFRYEARSTNEDGEFGDWAPLTPPGPFDSSLHAMLDLAFGDGDTGWDVVALRNDADGFSVEYRKGWEFFSEPGRDVLEEIRDLRAQVDEWKAQEPACICAAGGTVGLPASPWRILDPECPRHGGGECQPCATCGGGRWVIVKTSPTRDERVPCPVCTPEEQA